MRKVVPGKATTHRANHQSACSAHRVAEQTASGSTGNGTSVLVEAQTVPVALVIRKVTVVPPRLRRIGSGQRNERQGQGCAMARGA